MCSAGYAKAAGSCISNSEKNIMARKLPACDALCSSESRSGERSYIGYSTCSFLDLAITNSRSRS